MRLKLSASTAFFDKFTEILSEEQTLNRFLGSVSKRKKAVRRRYRLTALLLISGLPFLQAQTIYDNFEGSKVIHYHEKSGVLDTLVANPAPNKVNTSSTCALYVRNRSKKFDNIKMKLSSNLSDVSPYATYLGEPPKLKMKIYTSAPAGTLVEILLGSKRGNSDYPAGTNSQYQAYTTVTNAWEELEFMFSQIPQGSETATTEIDQVVLLFSPNSSTSDTYYFDEITGPGLVVSTPDKIVQPDNKVNKKTGPIVKKKTGTRTVKK